MSQGYIKLVKYVSDYNFDPDRNRGWGLMVRATGYEGLESEIFVYHRMEEADPYVGDLFEAITSINQYYEIPAYSPEDNTLRPDGECIPYYRRNQMEVFARSALEREEIWEYIKVDVSRLVADYNADLKMKATSSVLIEGTVPQVLTESDNNMLVDVEWKPAGEWDGTTISNPDTSKKGWLPVSIVESVFPGAEVPTNAKWFYNAPEDENFEDVFALVTEPFEQNLLDLNGIYLLFGEGGAYQVTEDALYWMANENYIIEGISQNPWPSDYVEGLDVDVLPVLIFSVPVSSS